MLQQHKHNTASSHDESDGTEVLSPEWGLDDWYDNLSQPGRKMVELHALTEERFLQFGSFLSDIHSRTMGVAEISTAIRDQMIGDDASAGIANLQMLVERMSIFLHDIQISSARNEKALTSLCETLERLHQPLQAFQRITKTLQVVGITTRVECSEFSGNNNNVTHLSDSIRRLGNLIAGNMNEIVDQVSILHSLSKDALRNESALNNGQSSRAMSVVEQARGVLASLVENRNAAMRQSEALTESSRAVSHSVAEIVSSIQFHDITRQQIEHVTETLDSFREAISDNFRSGVQEGRSALELEIAEGCKLQSEQLQNSSDELSAAVWRIIESLQSLAVSVTTLVDDTRKLGGDTERDGATFFAAIEPAIESVAAVLKDNLATAAHSTRAVNEVVSAADIMVQLVEEIERFGAEMKVIALNASIESVHVKAGGSSLGVIADSIQELAREALIQTVELASGLKEITENANTLSSVEHVDVESNDHDVTNLTKDSEAMLVALREANMSLLDGFARMDQQAGSLAEDISAVASSIQVHREAAEIISQGVESLNYISDHIDDSGDTISMDGPTRLFEGMTKRYSMKSERDIHDNRVGKKSEPVQKEETDPSAQELSINESHGLGANVELF